MDISIYEGRGEKVRLIGVFEFEFCPRVGEVIQVSGPMGDLDFLSVNRIEHVPVELPRSVVTHDKKPSISIFAEFESRFSG